MKKPLTIQQRRRSKYSYTPILLYSYTPIPAHSPKVPANRFPLVTHWFPQPVHFTTIRLAIFTIFNLKLIIIKLIL
jgi:hypothetical protein